MSSPERKDLTQRTVTTATRNDERQYGQSQMGPLFDTDRGRRIGMLHSQMPVLDRGPFELGEPSGLDETQLAIIEAINPAYIPPPPMNPDPYGTPYRNQQTGEGNPDPDWGYGP